jgi:hydroxyquinol 1,2-dioxygenase
MANNTESNITDNVLESIENTANPRVKTIMASLIRHLHAFVRDVELSEEEWLAAIQFLTRTGQKCDDKRQEFILLSDTLGVSMLVDAINHRARHGETESTVLGPFYRPGARELPFGASISSRDTGEPTVYSGRVLTPEGQPIAGALLDVWETNEEGFYDSQIPDLDGMDLRGLFRTNAAGEYKFVGIRPVSYPIPTDGPVGEMLEAIGRHPWRPAHIHLVISAEGFAPLTTHLFVAGDPYLTSDAVFGTKDSLVVEFVAHDSPEEAAQHGVRAPFYTAEYDFVLMPAG